MSQPEIFRRCSHCGASSKPGELFCAQCGNALATERSEELAQQNTSAATNDLPAGTATEQETSGARQSEQRTVHDAAPPTSSVAAAVPSPPNQNPAIASLRAGLAERGDLEDRVKPPADKQRRVSSVVLNEAAYDPSIRFILVVGFLFVLCLVLLLLSKWIV